MPAKNTETSTPEPVLEKLAIETPLSKIPEGFDTENCYVLLRKFQSGKAYQSGSLLLASDEKLPQFNAASDVLVLDTSIIGHLSNARFIRPIDDNR